VRRLTKILIAIVLVLVLLLAGIIAVPYYLLGINIFDRSGWTTLDSGAVQYLDFYGRPRTQWQQLEDSWYYFDPDTGNMVTGWLELPQGRYYLGEDGIRRSGWITLSDGSYYIDSETFTAVTGWFDQDGKRYYMNSQGRMSTGMTEVDGSRYCFSQEGFLLTGWQELDGRRFYLGEDGKMVTGWVDAEWGRCYLQEDGALGSGWTETDTGRYYLTQDGCVATGKVETPEGIFLLGEDGHPATGWFDLEGKRYYLTEEGKATLGWQEIDGSLYYFREDGVMARGKVILDGKNYYFASTGKHVYLVNAWNPLPDDYDPELADYNGKKIVAEALEPLKAMIKQVQSLGYYKVTSIHRSVASQQAIWDSRYNNFIAAGYGKAGALAEVAKQVAVPGTSEHHLGLAVDIDGVKAVHGWFFEHSWEYGFVVRYPDGKTDITGITYEPWHYRYVGKELAKELYELDMCLEEYMDMLTEQEGYGAGTASNPDR